MTLRVVLLTRSSRPSGAQMAWRLTEEGIKPVAIIVEKRGRMLSEQTTRQGFRVTGLGFGFLWRRLREALQIKSQFYLRRLLRQRYKNPVFLSIEEWALEHPDVRVFFVEDHNGAETAELLWRLEPDVGILTNTRRIKKEILELPRHGFFNLHLSALPQYAGLDSIFWALYHGEKEIGVTVHAAAEKIDRGDLLLQRRISISPLDDEASLYEKALWFGTHLMAEALKALEAGRIERKPQDPSQASYFSWPTPEQRKICRKSRNQNQRGEGKGEGVVRVLHVITRMVRGGAQENTLRTVLGLKARGYDVTLVTGPSWGKEGEILSEALEAGVEVVLIPQLVREISPWNDLVAFVKLSSYLSRKRFEILHTHTSKAGILGRLAARILKIPIVIHTPHGHVFHSYFPGWREKLFLFIERQAARGSDRLVALTGRCQEEHLRLGVGTPEQWVVIPSGVNEESLQDHRSRREEILKGLQIPAGRKIVGFVGRFAPVKGARYLLEALPEILGSVANTHSLLVGDGEERNELEERVHELGLRGKVTFTGCRKEISELISMMDVVVVPSLNEGMGRVIVEAGLLGKAVVGTEVGGIPELIEDGMTGLLVPPQNSSEIARAVVRLCQDPDLSKRLGESLRRKVLEGFTEKQMVEKIDHVYQATRVTLGRSHSTVNYPSQNDVAPKPKRTRRNSEIFGRLDRPETPEEVRVGR